MGSGKLDGTDYVQVLLTSQTWRDIAWKHQLVVFRPAKVEASTRQALLFIDGGRWNPKYENAQQDLPREASVFTRLANAIRAPVAVVREVPFQPLFERREDALIAYTFDSFLNTGDTDWPLLLPMVKSAARAMDAVQQIAQERWHIPIERFTVTGASKRGWTSWLTAAVDARVAGVAPMVIDMLNMRAQINLQRATFGDLSEEINDYSGIDLPGRIDSDLGHKLVGMVDPYSYRASLVQPKLILLGTNDRYWPLDALKLYWDGLPEPKRVLYMPNQGHSLRDVDRLIGGLAALHRYSAHGQTLPELSWSWNTAATDRLELTVHSSRRPRELTAWSASSTTRDFRDAHWSQEPCKRSAGTFTCHETLASRPLHCALFGGHLQGSWRAALFTVDCSLHRGWAGERLGELPDFNHGCDRGVAIGRLPRRGARIARPAADPRTGSIRTMQSGSSTGPLGAASYGHDRSLLLADAQWTQDPDVPGGDGACPSHHPGKPRQGRSVQPGLPRDRSEQPHACHRRSRAATGRASPFALRVRRDPALSRREDRRLLPTDLRGRAEVLQWLFWQVAGLGPMAGQIGHFNVYAPEKVPYAIERYTRETRPPVRRARSASRDRAFVAGEYSIADIACYPWIVPHTAHGQSLDAFPHLKRWFETDQQAAGDDSCVRGSERRLHPARATALGRGSKHSLRSRGRFPALACIRLISQITLEAYRDNH